MIVDLTHATDFSNGHLFLILNATSSSFLGSMTSKLQYIGCTNFLNIERNENALDLRQFQSTTRTYIAVYLHNGILTQVQQLLVFCNDSHLHLQRYTSLAHFR